MRYTTFKFQFVFRPRPSVGTALPPCCYGPGSTCVSIRHTVDGDFLFARRVNERIYITTGKSARPSSPVVTNTARTCSFRNMTTIKYTYCSTCKSRRVVVPPVNFFRPTTHSYNVVMMDTRRTGVRSVDPCFPRPLF